MVRYTCIYCQKIFDKKFNYDRHQQNRKKKCQNILEKQIEIYKKYTITSLLKEIYFAFKNTKYIKTLKSCKNKYVEKNKKDNLKAKKYYNEICLKEYKSVIREKIKENIQDVNIDKIVKKMNLTINKKQKISNIFKRQCWDYWIGEDIGKILCPCCNLTHITQLNFSCGHIIPESKGGELIVENVRPICFNCNSSVGTKNLNDIIAVNN